MYHSKSFISAVPNLWSSRWYASSFRGVCAVCQTIQWPPLLQIATVPNYTFHRSIQSPFNYQRSHNLNSDCCLCWRVANLKLHCFSL